MKTNVTRETKFYAVIGDPIAHSLSPVFQNYFIRQRNLDAIYIPLRITSDTLVDSLELLRNNFSGFNVTIPHKENIIQYLDEIDPLAIEYGAVNTVKIADGALMGYNTDGMGFARSLENININLKGKQVLLLGAGGAAKVIASKIVKLGGNLTIANRNIERGMQLKNQLEKSYDVFIDIIDPEELNTPSDILNPAKPHDYTDIIHPAKPDNYTDITNPAKPDTFFDVIINSTPVGMYPNIDKSPINPNILRGAKLVYDIIYNPFETELLKIGNKLGAKTINGLPMLIYQGLKSFEIWTGERATHNEEKEIYNMLKNAF